MLVQITNPEATAGPVPPMQTTKLKLQMLFYMWLSSVRSAVYEFDDGLHSFLPIYVFGFMPIPPCFGYYSLCSSDLQNWN